MAGTHRDRGPRGRCFSHHLAADRRRSAQQRHPSSFDPGGETQGAGIFDYDVEQLSTCTCDHPASDHHEGYCYAPIIDHPFGASIDPQWWTCPCGWNT